MEILQGYLVCLLAYTQGLKDAVKCGAGISSFFPVNAGVRQGCVLAPLLFNISVGWIMVQIADQSHCGTSVSNTKIYDLVCANDVIIFVKYLELLAIALELWHEVKPLGLQVPWPSALGSGAVG